MLSELAIAAKYNQGKAFGALTNGSMWVFFQVTAHTAGFNIRMSDQQQLYINPIGVAESTIKVIEVMCQALFPERIAFSQTDVTQALAAMDSRSHQSVHEAFKKYLSPAENSRLLTELAYKDKVIAQLQSDLDKRT
ncbi:hypothetical protein ABBQ38_000997 [Trebouxia sp. C0009 RCD-2024]